MDFAPEVWAAIVVGGAAILGSIPGMVTNMVASVQQRKSSAQQAEAAQGREDARVTALTDEAKRVDARARANRIAEELQVELAEVRQFPNSDDSKFLAHYSDRWRIARAIVFRGLIGRLPIEGDRLALSGLLDALDEQVDFANWNPGRSGRQTVEDVLMLGFELAMVMERGDIPDPGVAEKLRTLNSRLGVWQERRRAAQSLKWEEVQRELDEEAYQQHLAHEAAVEAAEQEAYERSAELSAHEAAERGTHHVEGVVRPGVEDSGIDSMRSR